MERPLSKIIEDFRQLRAEYLYDPLKGSGDSAEKDKLLTYSDKFTDLYEQLRPICSDVYGLRTLHDDKAASATKARIAKRMQEEDPKISWSKVIEYSAASEDYKDFLNERAYYYESWDSMAHLRDSIKQYIINIGQRLTHYK